MEVSELLSNNYGTKNVEGGSDRTKLGERNGVNLDFLKLQED